MESERFSIPAKAAADIMAARRTGGRVVAIGTTVVRALETVAREHGQVVPFEGRTDLFVHPPDRVASVDALLTNFHLPRSTLLMLVCSFAGRDLVMRAYSEAVRMEYRFYSYGDCMLVL
jgi:S-adenosylmethionine:tRNA ribosyltransferase-isomerase